MSAKWRVWLGGALLALVIAAALYFPALRRRIENVAQVTEKTTEQARRELVPPAPTASSEPRVKVKMFWGTPGVDGSLTPVTVELPLSTDPVLRAKEVLNTLLAGPVDPEARTLPPEAALLEFYLMTDGTAVADFSEALGSSIPSGIQSEQLAVESITRTLEANVPQVQRLKILIHGQEMDTLAGHVDLTQTFRVNTKVAPPLSAGAPPAAQPVSPAAPAPAAARPSDPAKPGEKKVAAPPAKPAGKP